MTPQQENVAKLIDLLNSLQINQHSECLCPSFLWTLLPVLDERNWSFQVVTATLCNSFSPQTIILQNTPLPSNTT